MQKKLLKQWFQEAKEEFRIEEEALRAEEIYNRWYNQFFRHVREQIGTVIDSTIQKLSLLETAISNLPLTVGALSLAIVTLGTVWFKFAEENLDSCKPVHFRNPRCTYHEYPGCFECDTTATWYKVAFSFHTTCTFISFVLAFAFFLKVIFATRLVVDEMTHPTMFAPAGLMCATLVSVFTGRFGWVGEAIVVMAASLHLFAVFMFFFMALTYRTLPDPSWFPNTVAVGYAGVKLWTYFPTAGILYMIVSILQRKNIERTHYIIITNFFHFFLFLWFLVVYDTFIHSFPHERVSCFFQLENWSPSGLDAGYCTFGCTLCIYSSRAAHAFR